MAKKHPLKRLIGLRTWIVLIVAAMVFLLRWRDRTSSLEKQK